MDSVGLILGGSSSEAVAIVQDIARTQGARGSSTVVGLAEPCAAGWAALVHGVAAHCFDFDDTFPDSVVHPGSAVVPTALAVAEETGASATEILTAIAGGYELAARLAGVAARRFHERGFHASGIFAPLCAAFTASRLYGLSAAQTAEAVGLAASMAGGLLAFLADGSWSKWLHLGWGNLGGVTAAQLARRGFRGPRGALDVRHNLYEAFVGATPEDIRGVDELLGSVWRNESSRFKIYPCAHVIQPYIDLALELRGNFGEPAQIERVTCIVAPWAVPIVCEPAAEKIRPKTMLQAIASLPFHVASALTDGRVGLSTLSDAQRARDDIAALSERVVYSVDDELAGFSAKLTITTADGRRFAGSGDAKTPDADRLASKFIELASMVISPVAARDAVETVARFAVAPDAAGITSLFRQVTLVT